MPARSRLLFVIVQVISSRDGGGECIQVLFEWRCDCEIWKAGINIDARQGRSHCKSASFSLRGARYSECSSMWNSSRVLEELF